MGCCMSTPDEQPGRDAPTTLSEEETVKEVLLETHVLPKAAITNDMQKEKTEAVETENQELLKAASFEPMVLQMQMKNASLEKPTAEDKEIEMSSFAESLSNVTDKNEIEDLGEVNQKLPSARKRHSDRQVARKRASPRRLTPRSPEKKGVTSSPEKKSMPRSPKRNVETEKDTKRERSVNEKALNGGKVADHRNLSENDNTKAAAAAAAAGVNGRTAEDDDLEVETLENPVVSFECFIFL